VNKILDNGLFWKLKYEASHRPCGELALERSLDWSLLSH